MDDGSNLAVFKTPSRPEIKNLDRLPLPDRSLVNYDFYGRYPSETAVRNAITIQGTRGCPWRCSYCHITWKTHNYRSAEHILEEIRLYHGMGIRRFGFVDDIFNIHRRNSEAFFNALIRENLDVQLFFSNGLRGDLLDPDYIDLMVEAGTVYMPLALDTGSARLQKLIRKNLKLDRLRQSLDHLCEKHPDVITGLYFMVGFPTETEEEAKETLDFVMQTKWIHFPEFFVTHIYPGTELVDLGMESGLTREAILRNENSPVHHIPDTVPFKDPEFISQLRLNFLMRYWYRKERLLRVLPGQMKVMTEDELLHYYGNFLQQPFANLGELLARFNITADELPVDQCRKPDEFAVEGLHAKIDAHFSRLYPLRDQGLKVLLIDATRHFSGRDEGALEGFLHPPLGLMYLGTYLHEQLPGKVQCKVIKSHADFDSFEELQRIARDYGPQLIGLRGMTYYRDHMHDIAAALREAGLTAPIIAGGAHPTTAFDRVLQDPNIDLAGLGEGEETMLELVTAMLAHSGQLPPFDQLKEIAGLALREPVTAAATLEPVK